MKKMVLLIAVLCAAAVGFTACSFFPNAGEIEIIKSSLDAAQKQGEEKQSDGNETETAPTQEGADGEDAAQETQAAVDPEPTEGMSGSEVEALVEEGIVPKEAMNSENGETTYDNQIITDTLQKYADNIVCKTIMIGGNNVMVQAVNNNDVTIPKATICITISDQEQSYDFYQMKAGAEILIPIEKGKGELPPAVSAKAAVSMAANEYTDISDRMEITPSQTDKEFSLSVKNNSDKPCRKLSITAKLYEGSTIIYAELSRKEDGIPPGASAVLKFSLPDAKGKENGRFDKAEYVLNEALA